MTRTSQLALVAAAALGAFLVNDNVSLTQPSSLVSRADARVGNPLTPGSIAGVNRRVERRAYRRGYYGGGYRPGLGLAAGAALSTAAAYDGGGYFGSGYDGNSGYGAYASDAYDTSGGDAYILHGNYISEADAVAYCAQRFRSYDPESRTILRHGQRVSCPQE